jgi:DNA-binding NtrC family response regulator
VTRIGSSAPRAVDVRIVAASNKDLLEELRAGRFRRDLYYRLHVLSVELPPLRARREDVARLAEHYLARVLPELGRERLSLAPEVLAALTAHDWPGNVRELKNVVERAAVAAAGPRVELCDLPAELLAAGSSPGVPPLDPANEPATPSGPEPDPTGEERVAVRRALDASAWNVVQAARALGISRRTMYRKLQRLGITRASA